MTQRDQPWYYPKTQLVTMLIALFSFLFISTPTFAQDTTQTPAQAPSQTSSSVNITSPTTNQAVGNNAIVPIEASIGGAAEYRIIIDSVDATGWLPAPYQTYEWNTGDLVTGEYTVTVEARPAANSIDIVRESVVVSVNNTPPLVSSSLIAGSTINGVVAVSGSTNGDSSTYQLALFNNKGGLILSTQQGQLSFSLDTTTLANGAYTVAISAEDSFGNRTLANVTFRIFNAPPAAPQQTNGQQLQPPSASTSSQATPAIISPAEVNEVVTGKPVGSTVTASTPSPVRANQVTPESEANQGSWRGQMWYWWLGIIAAGVVGAGFVIAHRSKRSSITA